MIFFLVFVSVDMLPVGGWDSRRLWYHFHWFLLLFAYGTVSFIGCLTCFFHWLFIALPIYGVLKNLRPFDVVAKIL